MDDTGPHEPPRSQCVVGRWACCSCCQASSVQSVRRGVGVCCVATPRHRSLVCHVTNLLEWPSTGVVTSVDSSEWTDTPEQRKKRAVERARACVAVFRDCAWLCDCRLRYVCCAELKRSAQSDVRRRLSGNVLPERVEPSKKRRRNSASGSSWIWRLRSLTTSTTRSTDPSRSSRFIKNAYAWQDHAG